MFVLINKICNHANPDKKKGQRVKGANYLRVRLCLTL